MPGEYRITVDAPGVAPKLPTRSTPFVPVTIVDADIELAPIQMPIR
jgi:hypothetical protein